jgi:hypothetical protein
MPVARLIRHRIRHRIRNLIRSRNQAAMARITRIPKS